MNEALCFIVGALIGAGSLAAFANHSGRGPMDFRHLEERQARITKAVEAVKQSNATLAALVLAEHSDEKDAVNRLVLTLKRMDEDAIKAVK